MSVPLAAFRGRVRVPPALAGAVFALAAKAIGSVLALAIFAVAARSLGEEAFGRLAVTFNVAAFLAAVAVLGQDALIIRSWAETRGAGDDGASRGAYLFGWRVTLAAGALAALGFWVAVGLIGPDRLSLTTEPAALGAAAAFLFGQTVLAYAAHAARAISGIRVSEPHGEVTWRLVTLAALVIGIAVVPAATATVFFAAAAAGSLLAAAIQAAMIRRDLPLAVRTARPRYATRAWAARSGRLAGSTTAEATAQYADVVLIGLLASPTASAAYFVAARFANVFAMIAGGLHGYTSSRFATLHYAGDRAGAQALLGTVIAVAFALVAALAAVVAVGGPLLLSLFGEGYRSEYATLIVLSAGTAFAALMGPSPVVLMATGHERLYGTTIIVALALRAAALAVAAPVAGAFGAAVAVSAVLIPTSLFLAVVCRRQVGADPSVLALLPGRAAARPAQNAADRS